MSGDVELGKKYWYEAIPVLFGARQDPLFHAVGYGTSELALVFDLWGAFHSIRNDFFHFSGCSGSLNSPDERQVIEGVVKL